MPFVPLLFFGLTIASWRFAQHHQDDVGQFLGLSAALVCLVATLATLSPFLQGLMLVGLLIYPLGCNTLKRS